MGLFDTLFGAFTGQPAIDAAQTQRQYMEAQYGDISRELGRGEQRGVGYLQTGLAQGLGALGPSYEQARADLGEYFGPAFQYPREYGQQALNELTAGRQGALEAYAPLQSALGLGTPEETAAARARFAGSPGYQFALEQGLESIARNTNRAGMLPSGNMIQESQRYGTGLAQQDWNNYVNQLGGLAGAQAGAYLQTAPRAADVYQQVGRGIGDLYSNQGRSLAQLSAAQGPAIAGLYSGTAQNQAQLLQNLLGQQAGVARSVIAPTASTIGAEGQAQLQGSQNIWNLLGNLAQTIF